MSETLPLAGIRVLDLTRNVAGPYGSMILADLGADVIKVERPGLGDDTRHWGPPFWGGQGPIYQAMNRNKRSVCLDLGRPEAGEVMRRLVAASDVLIESFRPGALERLGFGPAWAEAVNPRLIYVSVTSYGDRGPLRDRPGYDPLMQAFAGIMTMTGEADGPPVRAGVSVIDMGTGMWTALTVLTGLLQRQQSGRGGRFHTALYETALAWMAYHLATYWAAGVPPRRHGSGTATIAPYELFAAADGPLMVTAGNDGLFARLAAALGHPEWSADPRWRTNAERVANRQALHEAIESETRTRPLADLSAALAAAGVPCSPVRGLDEVSADAQAAALGILQAAPHPRIDEFRSVGLPLRLGGERPPLRRLPPDLGAHTREVLAELGFSEGEARALADGPACGGEAAATGG